MSAHEWTRARQRSLRREPQPSIPPSLEPPPTTEPVPSSSQEIIEDQEGSESAPTAIQLPTAEPSERPAEVVMASDNGIAIEVPLDETTVDDDEIPLQVEPPPQPPRVEVRRSPRRRPPSPPAIQAELPLDGLEPATESTGRRSASESREELIERLLDPHLSLQETAKLLDVCPTTVRRYTNRGLLAHYRTPGNQRRFRLSDVLDFMERQGIPAHGLERRRSPRPANNRPTNTEE